MKLFILALLSLTSASLFASTSTITCNVKEELEGKLVDIKIEFLVENLGSDMPVLLQHPKASEDMGPILVTPDMVGERWSDMTHLNAQGGDLRSAPDRIRLFGDGDGYTFVDLVLFKAAKYQKGYLRVSGSGDQSYQKISCTVK
jgi:hypothetical protein